MDAFRRKNHTLVTEADVHHQKAAAVSLAGSFPRHIAFTDVVIAFFAEDDRQHYRSHSGSVHEITDRQHHYALQERALYSLSAIHLLFS